MSGRKKLYDPVKRLFDIVGALILLIVTAPIQLVVAGLVAMKLGRPVIFAQQRPGKDGQIFTLYKFRSMRNVNAARGWITNEQRMTSFGQILRSTSLDELPSLWNIVRGEMSLVGPRPLRVSYVSRYSTEQLRRHEVRPGLTGMAQVRGRNALSWDDRLELDIEYVNSRSATLDLGILIDTFRTVLRRDGVAEEGEATKSEFFGPLRTSRMELVPLSADHLATRVEWLNDPRVRAGISISFTADLPSTEEWHRQVVTDDGRKDWAGVSRVDGSLLSMCGVQGGEEDGASSLYIYVAPDAHGKGYGRETMELLIAQARTVGLLRLTLETPVDNAAAIRLYDGLGFQDIGATENGKKRKMMMELTRGHKND